jgi:hypothetical protein
VVAALKAGEQLSNDQIQIKAGPIPIYPCTESVCVCVCVIRAQRDSERYAPLVISRHGSESVSMCVRDRHTHRESETSTHVRRRQRRAHTSYGCRYARMTAYSRMAVRRHAWPNARVYECAWSPIAAAAFVE